MVKIPDTPPPMSDLLVRLNQDLFPKVINIGQTTNGKYLHWDELRHRKPPKDLSTEEWWLGVKIARSSTMRALPMLDKDGKPFQYGMPDQVLEMLHEIDSKASGKLEASEAVTNPDTRDRYIVSSLIEEAITSSQLEGAATTRRTAVKMIRSGRRPINKDEQMIMNNYDGMNYVTEIRNDALSPELILNLHRILTANTLEEPNAAGQLQLPGENRVSVWDNARRIELHVPPRAEVLPQKMESLCDFANKKTKTGYFVHPVIRAIVLHFWLAYDHPFVDGNGRTARSLFYWSMLSQEYWLFEYISISKILRNAPAQYGRAFLHTETDDNNLTYFIIYHLKVVLRAINALEEYLKSKIREIKTLEKVLKKAPGFNHRQLALLSHAVRHPDSQYTVKSHRRSHNISNGTARSDLLRLVEQKLLDLDRIGEKTLRFSVPDDIDERLANLSGK